MEKDKKNKFKFKIKKPAICRAYDRVTNLPKFRKAMEKLNSIAVYLHIPLSFGICFLMEWLSRHSFTQACQFVVKHPAAYFFNSYVIFMALCLVFLTKYQSLLRIIISVLFIVFGVINSIILTNRVTPFGFTDLAMIGDLLTMQNTKYFTAQQAMMSIVAFIIFASMMTYRFFNGHTQEHKIKKPAIRYALVAAAFLFLPVLTISFQKAKLLDTYFGNLAQGYLDNGYLYGFGTSFLGRGMSQPAGYSEKKIDQIVASTDIGESTNEISPNIIVVLLESFYDVSESSFIKPSQDPIPYFHKLEKKYSTGYCTVPVVGAGTCNTEFEVLTGMSCAFFGPGEYPQKTILKKTDCESFADATKKLGYGTHVVHNNGGNFYSRANAFSQMGFDTFTSKELLDITEFTPMGTWATDDILVGATKDALDSTDGPDFCYTITVGSHGDYPKEKIIDDPVVTVECEGKDEEKTNQWEYYCNMLNNVDRFIQEYTTMLSQRGEPTLLVMFGDHLPTMGLEPSEVKSHDLFKTKYVTWNNFGMQKQDMDLTSYQLVSEYLDRLGIHGGTMLNFNQSKLKKQIPPTADSYQDELKLLQYDILYGKRYAYQGVDMYPASDLTMGINDVVIDRTYSFDNKLHIYGENFTKWSKVYINGNKVNTTYESGQVLTIPKRNIEDGDEITVCQLGSNNTIFRSSNTYLYEDKGAEEIPT